MIVLDESLDNDLLVTAIARWYHGRVLSICTLRPDTLVKDDAVPVLLRQVSAPTFVTINVADFWRIAPSDIRYCIIAIDLAQNQAIKLPAILRQVFRRSGLHTKALRMGKVIRVQPTVIEYYESDRQIHTLAWLGQ